MTFARIVEDFFDAYFCWPMTMSPCWCAHTMTAVCMPWLMMLPIGKRNLHEANSPLQKLSDIFQYKCNPQCTHATTNVRRPWLMLHSIGKCHFTYVHIPCRISYGPGWFCLLLDDIAYSKHTNLCWWCLSMGNVKSLIWCTHVTCYVCMPLMILHVVFQCRF